MEWGELALAAQAEGSLAPAWKKFIKTKFFVAILRSQDDDPKNFRLHVPAATEDGMFALTISEMRERLGQQHGDGVVALSGDDILARLEAGAAIEVLLADTVFSISKKRVAWLRSGINVTRARIATRKELAAAAPAAPLPVLVVERRAPEAPRGAQVSGPAPARPRPAVKVPKLSPYIKSFYNWQVIAAVLGFVAFTGIMIVVATMGRSTDEEIPVQVAAAPTPAPVSAAPVMPGQPAGPVEQSVPFSPADNSFTVNVPGMVEEVELSPDQVSRLADMESHQYRLVVDDRSYAMEASEYRENPPANINAAMDEVQRTIVGSGTLIATNSVPMRGATGREVRVRLPGGGERAARYVFNGKKYGMVMVTVSDSERSASHIDAFLKSFQLNSPPAPGM